MKKRDLPALSTRAAIGSVNDEKRTVDMVFSTGAKVLRSSFWDGPFYEELSMDPSHVRMGRLNSGAPFLPNHDSYDVAGVLGVVESARIEGGKGIATVRFAKAEDDQDADQVYRKIKDGVIRNVSVGYRIHKFEEVDAGDKETPPTFRATDWEPYEISAVAIGADPSASFRSADHKNSCEFVTRSTHTTEQRKMDPKNETPAPATAPVVDADVVRAEAVKAERARVASIQNDVRSAKLGDELATKLIDSGVTLEEARAQIFDAMKKRNESSGVKENGGGAAVVVTDDAADKFFRGATAGLIARVGKTEMIREAAKKDPQLVIEADPAEFRRMTVPEMAREFLELRGIDTRRMDKTALVKRALTFRSTGMATTSDFTVLLENVMYKILLGQYATTPDTWTRFCGVDSVQDFRASNRYRLGSFGALDAKNEHGEFKHKAIPDGEKHSITVSTKGNIIAIDRETLVNDDMGALASQASMLGRAAALSIELDVYALLAQNSGLGPTMSDSLPLFDSGHHNIGTGAALSVASIDADRVVMMSQKDPSGNELLDLRPSILLVPAGLGGDARVINESRYDPTTGTATLERPNKVAGLYTQIVDTARLTGTRRYSFADLSTPAIVVAFLNGQRAPYMEQRIGWDVDGTELKVRLDYGVQAFDYRGAVTNAGA